MSSTGNTTRSPTDAVVGKRIRPARKLAKLSQSDLGQAIGVTYRQHDGMSVS